MEWSPIRLTCTTVELVVMAGVSGAAVLQGVANPFHGWLAVEIEEAWNQAEAHLVERGWLRLTPGRAPSLDPTIRPTIETCCFPEATCVVSATSAEEGSQIRHYHLAGESAVELVVQSGGPATCELTQLAGIEDVLARAVKLLAIRDQAAAPAGPDWTGATPVGGVVLPEEALKEARRLAAEAGPETVQRRLLQAGVGPETAQNLASVLARPALNAAALVLRHDPVRATARGFGMLAGQDGLWLLAREGTPTEGLIRLTPATGAHVEAELRRLLATVWPDLVSAS